MMRMTMTMTRKIIPLVALLLHVQVAALPQPLHQQPAEDVYVDLYSSFTVPSPTASSLSSSPSSKVWALSEDEVEEAYGGRKNTHIILDPLQVCVFPTYISLPTEQLQQDLRVALEELVSTQLDEQYGPAFNYVAFTEATIQWYSGNEGTDQQCGTLAHVLPMGKTAAAAVATKRNVMLPGTIPAASSTAAAATPCTCALYKGAVVNLKTTSVAPPSPPTMTSYSYSSSTAEVITSPSTSTTPDVLEPQIGTILQEELIASLQELGSSSARNAGPEGVQQEGGTPFYTELKGASIAWNVAERQQGDGQLVLVPPQLAQPEAVEPSATAAKEEKEEEEEEQEQEQPLLLRKTVAPISTPPELSIVAATSMENNDQPQQKKIVLLSLTSIAGVVLLVAIVLMCCYGYKRYQGHKVRSATSSSSSNNHITTQDDNDDANGIRNSIVVGIAGVDHQRSNPPRKDDGEGDTATVISHEDDEDHIIIDEERGIGVVAGEGGINNNTSNSTSNRRSWFSLKKKKKKSSPSASSTLPSLPLSEEQDAADEHHAANHKRENTNTSNSSSDSGSGSSDDNEEIGSEVAHYERGELLDCISVGSEAASAWTVGTSINQFSIDGLSFGGGGNSYYNSNHNPNKSLAEMLAVKETFDRDRQITLQKDMLHSDWFAVGGAGAGAGTAGTTGAYTAPNGNIQPPSSTSSNRRISRTIRRLHNDDDDTFHGVDDEDDEDNDDDPQHHLVIGKNNIKNNITNNNDNNSATAALFQQANGQGEEIFLMPPRRSATAADSKKR